MPHVTERWLGGTLTNFRTSRSRLNYLKELDGLEASGAVAITADRRLYDRTRATPHADRLQWLGFVTG